jgi:hypothetical protein
MTGRAQTQRELRIAYREFCMESSTADVRILISAFIGQTALGVGNVCVSG